MKKTAEEMLTRGKGNFINCTDYDDALTAMHQYAAQESAKAVQKRDSELELLIIAMNDYITVLGKELDDCAVMLSVHGWQSKRVQEGIDARNKILEIKKSLSTPTSEEIAQAEPTIPIRELEELRDEYNRIAEETTLSTKKANYYEFTMMLTLLIEQSKKK